MFLTYGQTRGLAYKHNWDQERSLRLELFKERKKAKEEAAEEVKFVGEKLKTDKANFRYTQDLLNNYYPEKLQEIGKYLSENPNWKTDPFAMAKFNDMTRELTDNPILQLDRRVMNERKLQEEYLKENPDMLLNPDIVRQDEEFRRCVS